jgi:hypothetical protein
VTFYSDEHCTKNQIEDDLGGCGSLPQSNESSPAGIYSFSIDFSESPDSNHRAFTIASTTTTSVESSPTNTTNDSGDGNKLATSSEIVGIVGGICAVIAIVISVVFGMNRWKKHHEIVPQWLKSLEKCIPWRHKHKHGWFC